MAWSAPSAIFVPVLYWLCWMRLRDRSGITGPVVGVVATVGVGAAAGLGGFLAVRLGVQEDIVWRVVAVATILSAGWITWSVLDGD